MGSNPLVRKTRKGLNIFYYGKGKGKTTAAMGLAARAAGADMDVFILQFVKSKAAAKGQKLQSGEWPISSEILFFNAAKKSSVKSIGKITTEQTGAGFVGILGDKKQRSVHIKEANKGLLLAKKIINSDKYDLIILDELVSAVELGLFSEKEVVALVKQKPKHLHLAYTGHDAFENIIACSDLVSEIKMIKHPYYKGILAQRGIDF
ncbi:MAG: Cob(I)alamin adenosyltransferase [Candidatus Doudnabacteria bacterium]|nr:Cob(I)alamin adenosyltransferase [Candidatus Doudnabacteria bacterium]